MAFFLGDGRLRAYGEPMSKVREHLRLLSIFHYVIGGFLALASLFPMLYVVMGAVFLFLEPAAHSPEIVESAAPLEEVDSPQTGDAEPVTHAAGNRATQQQEQELVGGIFLVIGAIGVLVIWTLAIFAMIAGRRLARHRSHTFCLVVAATECLFMPLGTVLGVFTILVLVKPEARELFGLPRLDDEATPASPAA